MELKLLMKILKEFREFAVKGNAVDMAVGIVIGAAFGKIVSSLVADVIMPPLGLLISGIDFKKLAIVLREAQGDASAVTLNYGAFIQTVLDFTIIAFAIFLFVKAVNTVRRNEETKPDTAPPPSPPEVQLLGEIRDLLREKQSQRV